ncbi:hypothetical protein COO60DRAFT_1538493 [Scenedesmus sp. NREL 46B-D3]|nr:hypothetical protein COO60DRAFT_1538493 [Scenedesmus sp. NREL 46B-D3]
MTWRRDALPRLQVVCGWLVQRASSHCSCVVRSSCAGTGGLHPEARPQQWALLAVELCTVFMQCRSWMGASQPDGCDDASI